MAKMRLRYAVLTLLLALVVAVAVLWTYRNVLLNAYLRPQFEQKIGEPLGAEVRLGKITLSPSRLLLTNLKLDAPSRFRAEIGTMDIRFSFGRLFKKQIDEIRINAPQITILAPVDRPSSPSSALPPKPPLEVARLEIRNGRIVVPVGDHPLQFDAIQARVAGTARSRFEVAAFLGENGGIPVSFKGESTWGTPFSVVLEHMNWDNQPLLSEPLHIVLAGEGAEVSGQMRLERLRRSDLERVAAVAGIENPIPVEWDFDTASPQVSLKFSPQGLDISLEAPQITITGPDLRVPAEEIKFHALQQEGTWRGKGLFRVHQASAEINFEYGNKTASGPWKIDIPDVRTFQRKLTGQSFDTAGGATLQGTFRVRPDQFELQGRLDGKHSKVRGPFLLNLIPLQARLTAALEHGKVTAETGIFLSGRQIATVSGSPAAIELELNPVTLNDLRTITDPAYLPEGIKGIQGLTAAARIQLSSAGKWNGTVRARAQSVEGTEVSINNLTTSARLRGDGPRLEIEETTLTGQLEGAELASGALSLTASGSLEGKSFHLAFHPLQATGLEYLSGDGLSGLSAGRFRAEGSVSGHLESSVLTTALTATFGAGEALRGPFYADFSPVAATLNVDGDLDFASRVFRTRTFRFQAPDIGTLSLNGTFAPENLSLSGSFKTAQLEGPLSRYIHGGLEAGLPAMKDLKLSGILSGHFTVLHTRHQWRVRGGITPGALGLKWAKGRIEASGGNGFIPFDLETGPPVQNADRQIRQPGILTFSDLQVGPARLASEPIRFNIATNRIEIPRFPHWNLAGGHVDVTGLAASIRSGTPELTTRLRLEGIDLEALTRDFGLVPMRGRLSADLGEIGYSEDTFSSAGQANIQAFGGTATISNIRLRAPFSPYPILHGDVDFNKVDLSQLTRTFEFGEMNGIIDGYIHNLRLLGTTPSRFDAEFATLGQGKRNISVKALNNLTVISQGGLSAALSRGIYRFIDFYRYQKLGIRCTLKHDVFRLEGTARPGDNSYLVYGGLLPPKINIIAPGRDISFKEMLKRLSRLDRAGH